MDEQVLERARQRVAEARTEGIAGARLDAALERARAEVMRLAQVADELETSLPKQVGIAVRDGIVCTRSPLGMPEGEQDLGSGALIHGSVALGGPAPGMRAKVATPDSSQTWRDAASRGGYGRG